MRRVPTVALVTHDLDAGGGTATLTSFLHTVLVRSGRYQPAVISLATSRTDAASVRLMSPASWQRGPEVVCRRWRDVSYQHVGAWATEFEPCRYRPRRILSSLLAGHDLVQVIAGIAPWAAVVRPVSKPAVLWVATTVAGDRFSRLRRVKGFRGGWLRAMTRIATSLERRALRDSQTVFALSHYTARSIQTLERGVDVRVVPCGVDTDVFKPSETGSTTYILSVARFSDPRKNVTMLLLAYARLCAALPEAPMLYLVGEPPTAKDQRLLADLGIENRVRLLGFMPDSQLADLYRGALFFVLSSDEEGLGMVVLEAMASGLATVVTRCGGPEDLVKDGHSGFLVPVRDDAALALAMRRVLAEPGLSARFGRRAREIAVDRFSLDAAGQVFLSTYDKLLQPEL